MTARQMNHPLQPTAEVVMSAAEIRTNRPAWLAARRHGVGGSDIAALMGDSNYKISEYDVWLDKTGRAKPAQPTDAMEMGNHFEAFVADLFARRNGFQLVPAGLMRSVTHPHAMATADRLVSDGGGLEIKYQEWFMAKKYADGHWPRAFYWQCVQGLAVTGLPHWWFASMLGARDLQVRRVNRADVRGDIDTVLERCEAWWDYVATDTRPSNGVPADLPELLADSVEASMPELVIDDVERWEEILRAEAEMSAEKKDIQARMMLELGGHKALTISGIPRVRLVVRKGSSTFNRPGLKRDHPEIEAQYASTGQPSRFPQLIKEAS